MRYNENYDIFQSKGAGNIIVVSNNLSGSTFNYQELDEITNKIKPYLG